MQQDFPEEFQWLAELAHDVNQLSGFYTNQETAAIYCPNCKTIQTYCTGCGKKLIDVYNEDNHDCENCGISLTHCGICGYAVEEQTSAPEHLQKPEYWKYCPACGDSIFAVTDMCPSCKISMATHLDAIYEETYSRVNQVVLEEEMGGSKRKQKPSTIQGRDDDGLIGKFVEKAILPIIIKMSDTTMKLLGKYPKD